jgi:hypothetical protein
MRRRQLLRAATLLPLARLAGAQPAFDHSHGGWDALLNKHVRPIAAGNASQVDYRGFAADRAALGRYLQSLSAVTPAQYAAWSRAQQYAFLANAYNAFAFEKVLSRYPGLKSIRDFGRVIGRATARATATTRARRRSSCRRSSTGIARTSRRATAVSVGCRTWWPAKPANWPTLRPTATGCGPGRCRSASSTTTGH